MSPGASSFPCGLSGGDSGQGSQRGDGGRGPGSRLLLPLTSPPPPPRLGPPPSRSQLAPLRAPSWSGLLGLEVGWRHAAFGTPTSPGGARCCGLRLPPCPVQDRGDWDGVRPRSHCPDPRERDDAQDLPPRSAINLFPRPADPGGVGGEQRGGGSAQTPRAGCEGRRQCSEPPPAGVGSRKEGRRSGPPLPGYRIPLGGRGRRVGREGGGSG